MQQIFHEIKIKTQGQGFYNFTDQTIAWISKQKINNGILNINILHTSASLVIQENADPDVLYDLKSFNSLTIKANADECKKFTGFSIGGVSPVAHANSPKSILIDTNLSNYKEIFAAAGHPYVVFGISFIS